jgi:hypothetical protein
MYFTGNANRDRGIPRQRRAASTVIERYFLGLGYVTGGLPEMDVTRDSARVTPPERYTSWSRYRSR